MAKTSEERLAYVKEWRRKHPEKCLEYHRRGNGKYKRQKSEYAKRKNQEWKIQVLTHYAGGLPKCTRCGFSDIRALSIDHINGGGNRHRQEIKRTFYHWLIQQNYPLGYQVLCMNCQFIKRVEEEEVPYGGNW